MHYNIDDTIVAISTPIGEGGIGIVRLSGQDALKISDEIFVSKDGKRPSEFETHSIHYGHIVNSPQSTVHSPQSKYSRLHTKPPSSPLPAPSSIIDEVLLTVMRSPKTYTREDTVEINCHGGIQATKNVLEVIIKNGARIAQPGEFTKRAFLNGRIDLAQAEAVLDVIRAKTEGSLKVAMGQLDGELSKKIDAARTQIIDITSSIEASIDFPDEELEIMNEGQIAAKVSGVLAELKGLIASYDGGAVLREGILAIICGKPNVGKSSLMNLLLKRDRVIVSELPGTTRDAVEEMINLRGIPIRLVDTAGIIETKDMVEKEGVKKSKIYLALADLALFVLDGSTGIEDEDINIAKLVSDKKAVVIINKADLPKKTDAGKARFFFKTDRMVEISVLKRDNIDILEKLIIDVVWSGGFDHSESAVVSNIRHKELLDKSLGNMLSVDRALKKRESPEIIAVDLKEALFNLGLIIGKSVSEDVLERIFEQFCIGK